MKVFYYMHYAHFMFGSFVQTDPLLVLRNKEFVLNVLNYYLPNIALLENLNLFFLILQQCNIR